MFLLKLRAPDQEFGIQFPLLVFVHQGDGIVEHLAILSQFAFLIKSTTHLIIDVFALLDWFGLFTKIPVAIQHAHVISDGMAMGVWILPAHQILTITAVSVFVLILLTSASLGNFIMVFNAFIIRILAQGELDGIKLLVFRLEIARTAIMKKILFVSLCRKDATLLLFGPMANV